MQQGNVKCWIQNADLSSDELGAIGLTDALRRYRAHDWNSQLSRLRELEDSGNECCPPGMGFVVRSHYILHLCPNGDGTVTVHFHYPKPFLGFLWERQVTETNTSLSDLKVAGLLEMLFAGRYEQIDVAA
jgi:hypothetical protein